MEFRQIEIDDYEKASAIMYSCGIENCEHCFPTMLEWSFRHGIQIAIEEDTVFMRSKGRKHMWYLFPRGKMDRKKAMDMIISDAAQQGMPVSIYGVDEANALFLQENGRRFVAIRHENRLPEEIMPYFCFLAPRVIDGTSCLSFEVDDCGKPVIPELNPQ